MLACRVREHKEEKQKNATQEMRATKYIRSIYSGVYTKRIKNKRIPRWGRVQMTQAERTRTIKYVLAQSSIIRLSLGRRLVNLLPVAQRTNAPHKWRRRQTMSRWS